MFLRASRAAAAALMMVLLGLATAAPTATATPTSFAWHAPADATGPGAFRVDLDFGEANTCTVVLEATAGAYLGPDLFLSFGSGWGMSASGHLVQAHSEALAVDTRSAPSGASGFRFILEDWTFSGETTLTILNAEMDGWLATQPDPWFPARFDVACADEITVLGFSGSREVGSFSDDTMSGGEGASANGLFARAAVTLGDTYARSFTTSHVEVDVIEFGTSVADWTLTGPSSSVSSGGVGIGTEFEYEDGPGDYSFTMDRLGEGYLWAWLAGFDAVGDLDDLFA